MFAGGRESSNFRHLFQKTPSDGTVTPGYLSASNARAQFSGSPKDASRIKGNRVVMATELSGDRAHRPRLGMMKPENRRALFGAHRESATPATQNLDLVLNAAVGVAPWIRHRPGTVCQSLPVLLAEFPGEPSTASR